MAGASLLLLGALSACGGRPISAGVTNVPEAAGSGSASTVPNFSLAAGSGRPSTPAPTSATPGALGGAGGGAGSGAFCRDLVAQQSLLPSILSGASTPGKLSGVLQQARQSNAKVLRDAPAAIRGDVQTLVTFGNRLFDDVSASPPKLQDVTAIVADPKYRAASASVGRYAAAHCASFVPPTTTP